MDLTCPESLVEFDSAPAGPLVLVDDDDLGTLLIQRCYEELGYDRELRVYVSAPDFISYMNRVCDGAEDMPHAVLLDLNMYGLTGLDVLTKVRSMDATATLPPIYMLTHSQDVEDRQRALSLGAAGYFVKPGAIDQFTRLFETVIESNPEGLQTPG